MIHGRVWRADRNPIFSETMTINLFFLPRSIQSETDSYETLPLNQSNQHNLGCFEPLCCFRSAVCSCDPVTFCLQPAFNQEVWTNEIWLTHLFMCNKRVASWPCDIIGTQNATARSHQLLPENRVLRRSLVDPDRVAFKNEATVDTASLPQPFIILSGLFFFFFFSFLAADSELGEFRCTMGGNAETSFL